jgi:hypothetical protein
MIETYYVQMYMDVHLNVRSRGDSLFARKLPVCSLQAASVPFHCHPCQLFLTFVRRELRFESPSFQEANTDITTLMYLTEQGGFEPPVPLGTTVFKTASLNRSDTAPVEMLDKYT